MTEWRERLIAAWPKLVGLAVFAAALAVQGRTLTTLADDDGVYVAVGRALAHGHLVYPHLPGQPPAVGVGPAYPAALALVWRAWADYPANQTLAALVDALCFGAAAALLVVVLTRGGSGWLTRFIAVPCGFLSFPLLAEAGARQALPLFLVLAAGAMAVLQPATSVRRAALAGLLAGVATLTLSAGIGLALGLGLVVLWRDRRAAGALVGVAILVVAPWLVWQGHVAAPLASGAFAALATAATTLAGRGAVGLATIAVLVTLSLYGWWREVRHAPLVAAGLGGATLAALVAPRADHGIWIALPGIVIGAAAAVDRTRRDPFLAWPTAIAAIAVAAVLIGRQVVAMGGGGPVGPTAVAARNETILLTSFLVELPGGPVVATSHEARFFLATERTAIPALTAGDNPPLGATLVRRYCAAGVALIAVPDSASSAGTAVRALLRDQPASLEQLFQVTRGPALYRFQCPR